MTRIYTRTGDRGETGLFDGSRVSKHAPRVEAYGDVDELNAVLGLALADMRAEEDLHTCLLAIQRHLFMVGAQLADPSARLEAKRGTKASLTADHITQLEHWIDQFEAQLFPLRQFVLPGGCRGGATLHLARTVCRRAERHIVALSQQTEVAPLIITYVNRLSDLLFVAARLENHRQDHHEIPW